MKRRASYKVFFFFLILLAALHPSPARADDMWAKLGRGACNVLFCPVEIPYQMSVIGKTERAPVAFFGGFGKGLFTGARRLLVGAYEVITFPFPSYEPVLPPEFIVPEFLA